MQKDVVKTIEDSSNSLLMSVFKKENPIDSQLPIVFKSGYKLEEFSTKCHCCSANLKGNLFKGSIFKVEKNSRFECWSVDKIDKDNSEESDLEKIMIDAVGFCPQCSVYTPCQIHVEDKGLSEEEALAREKLLEEKRKEKRSKSFLGLSIEKMDSVKSQRNRIGKTTNKKIQEAALSSINMDNSKKMETTKLSQLAKNGVDEKIVADSPVAQAQFQTSPTANKKTGFLKQSTTVKKTLVDSRVEEIIRKQDELENAGRVDDNIIDVNAISRLGSKNAISEGSKSADAFKVGAMLTQPAKQTLMTDPSSELTKDSLVKEPTFVTTPKDVSTQSVAHNVTQPVAKAEPKLGFLNRNAQSVAAKKLQEALIADSSENQVVNVEAPQHRNIPGLSNRGNVANIGVNEQVVSNIPNAPKNPLLRGKNTQRVEPGYVANSFDNAEEEKPVVRRDSRGIKGSSTSVAAKIETKRYVQSSGSLSEKLTTGIMEFFGLFGKMITNIKLKQENKKKDILKNFSYKTEAHSKNSARSRLESLRSGIEGQEKEFVRKPVVQAKPKPKKHNHDSFR